MNPAAVRINLYLEDIRFLFAGKGAIGKSAKGTTA
jgi:hypothetical protein